MTIGSFWNWFSDNETRLFEYDDNNADETMKEIHENLNQVENGLGVEISKKIDNKRQIEISAEGNIKKFDLIKRIVAEAPVLDKWKIVAFRQPSTDGFMLKFDEFELDTSKLFFLPVEQDDDIDIVIYGENFKEYDEKKLAQYGFIMVDNLLGEYDTVIKVRYFDFEDISTVDNKEDLNPLEDLTDYIQWYYSK